MTSQPPLPMMVPRGHSVDPNDPESLRACVDGLVSLPSETEWCEWKESNQDPQAIGQYISAISNSAALAGRDVGFVVWGVRSGTRELVGTSFDPASARRGNQPLKLWLSQNLEPRVDFEFYAGQVRGVPVVLLELQAAPGQPVRFGGTAYIRVGECKTELRKYPERERAIWALPTTRPFEAGTARSGLDAAKALESLDYRKYFALLGEPLPTTQEAVLERLTSEGMVERNVRGSYDVKNIGAVLFAHRLSQFPSVARKALRVIVYQGTNRAATIKERIVDAGYAVGFEDAMAYINDQLPQNEQIGEALRRQVRVYPEIAVREIVANALIHQHFAPSGSGPTVEVFRDRMEIVNPGPPLIDTLRFIDEPPRSRNEALASLMRRLGMCEERGSGIDKVIIQAEVYQLPAPDFRSTETATIVVMFGDRTFSKMDKADRIRACYQHACLQYVSGTQMSNASLRKRFGIADSNYPQASRVIRDTLAMNLVKPYAQLSTSNKDAKYVPFWA